MPAPAPWKKSTGFKVKEEVSDEVVEPMEEEVELPPIPNKKLKLKLAEMLTLVNWLCEGGGGGILTIQLTMYIVNCIVN